MLFFISCNQSKKSEKNTVTLEGYFSKNDLNFDTEIKQLVLTHKKDFDHYFGMASTMNNKISEVNFDRYNYAAIITKPSAKKTQIKIISFEENNNRLTINYHLNKKEKQSFTSNDVKIFQISKDIKSINFILGTTSKLIEIKK